MKYFLIIFFLSLSLYSQNKNVLFIAVDDLKPMLGCYGDKQIKTPNIDSIANQGAVFLRNYCQWPVCGGSRASLMSGLYPESTGIMDLKTKMRDVYPDILTLPQYLKQNGYETAGVGKIYDPRCVDNSKDLDAPSWSVPFTKFNYGKIVRDGKEFAGVNSVSDEKTTDGYIAREGIKLMQKLATGKKPFFLAVGFKKPHLPFYAPQKYWDMYKRDSIKTADFEGIAKGASDYGWKCSNEFRGYKGVPKGKITDDIKKKAIHGYMACVSLIDAQVGLLLKELKKQKLDKNTVVVFWGDHGFHLGDHSLWGKHTNLEQAAIAPLIIKVPGQKSKTVKSPSGLIDIFPTLCEATGVKVPSVLQGRSLMPVISGSKEKVREGIITVYKSKGAMGYSYRTDRYRYIEWIKKGLVVGVDLFDYIEDPLEKVNIAATPEGKRIAKELSKLMRSEGKGCKKLYLNQASK